jgi:glycosyltransferase involved in cell wall biosynthesis
VKVSVIMPVYNCERYVREAIESILAQTRAADEIIAVDDGSVDGSKDVITSFGDSVRYVRQRNQGAGVARNTGIGLATGDFLTFLDSDDVWTPDKTQTQLEAFDGSPDLDIVFGHVEQFISPELDDETKQRVDCPETLMAGYIPGAMMVRRSAFERVGQFETGVVVGEFLGWYLRASEQGLVVQLLPEVVMHRRIHTSNTMITNRAAHTDYVRLLKASLDRRRGLSAD